MFSNLYAVLYVLARIFGWNFLHSPRVGSWFGLKATSSPGKTRSHGQTGKRLPWSFRGVLLIYQCDIITQHGGRPMTVLVAPPQTISFSRECR